MTVSGTVRAVDIEQGFTIEHPATVLPWGIDEDELLDLLARAPRRVTAGYHTLDCTALDGMLLTAGFHFTPRRDGMLHKIELFRAETLDLDTSYARFQHHLRSAFGEPHETTHPPGVQPSHEWRFGDVVVRHYVTRRFVQEEHIVVERRSEA